MKTRWNRWWSVLLVISILFSMLPLTAGTAESMKYGKVTGDKKVNVREETSTKSNALFQLEPGIVCEVTEKQYVDSKTWYLVKATNPENNRIENGAILGDFFVMLTDAEEADYLANGQKPIPSNSPAPSGAYGKINRGGGTNFRYGASTSDKIIDKLDLGTVVELKEIPAVISDNTWYKVQYNGYVGYVMSPYITVVSSGGLPTAQPDGPTPAPTTAPATDPVGYLKTTKGGVNVWNGIGSGKERVTVVNKSGTQLPYYGGPYGNDGSSYKWYYIQANGVYGYIRSDCVKTTNTTPAITPAPTPTQAPADPTATPDPAAPTPTPAVTPAPGGPIGYVRTVKGGVYVRAKAGSDGKVVATAAKGLTLPYYAGPTKNGTNSWYYIEINGVKGYIRSDTVRVTESPVQPTAAPSQPPVTPAPVGPTTAPGEYGYVTTIMGGCNLRITPGGESQTQIKKGVTLPLLDASPVKKSGYTWYHVSYNNMTGYLRNDVLKQSGPSGEPTPTPGPTAAPTATPAPDPGQLSSYLYTAMDKVYLRTGPGKSNPSAVQVPIGTTMSYGATQKVGTATWYQVKYNGSTLWVLGDCVHVMTVKEYEEYIATQPTATPEPITVIKGYVKTTVGGLNMRRNCVGDTTVITQLKKGVVLPYLNDPSIVKGQVWYYVQDPQYGRGYVLGEYVTLCDEKGNVTTPDPVTVSPGKKEATYTTLRLGSTGEAVEKLVTELKKQGYYTGDITATYNTSVETAVYAFQKAKGLTEDGIAGSDTQHALFGTVPSGQGGDLTMTLYAAEKIDWALADSIWEKGATYRVYDVKTGIVWQARRWSGFAHVDAEPLTAADTARLCKMYGVKTAKEIDTKNLYQRRPSLVTIGNHTYACSLYGIPHNYPDGDTIANNNFEGQLCIHFTNSKVSKSGKVDSGHKQAIEDAYNWSHGRTQ